MDMSPTTKIAILSDTHITDHDQKWEQLLAVLDGIRDDHSITELWLLGDIFDLLVGNFRFWTQHYGEFFFRLREIRSRGATITWLEGNHDFHFPELARHYGFHLLDRLVEQTYVTPSAHHAAHHNYQGYRSYRALFAHGDLVNSQDTAYLKWRETTRNPWFRRWVDSFVEPMAERVLLPLANWQSRKSRQRNRLSRDHDVTQVRELYRGYARDCFSKGYDAVFLGHCHVPELFEQDHRFYLNLGTWLDPHHRVWATWIPGELPQIHRLSVDNAK